MEQRTAISISLGTKLGLFWGVTTMITKTSLHKALQVCDKSLPITSPARIWGHSEHCDHDGHIRHLLRQSRTPSLAATMNIVSQGSHVRRLSRRSHTSFLEAVTYVVSRGSPARRLSCRTRTWNVVRGCRCYVHCTCIQTSQKLAHARINVEALSCPGGPNRSKWKMILLSGSQFWN